MKETEVKGVLFDLDGTIYENGRLIDGARETLEFCRQQRWPYRFVTNTTRKPSAIVAEMLHSLGVDVDAEWIFTPAAAARSRLAGRKISRCHFLLKKSLMADFQGIEPVDEAPQAVVIGDLGNEFSYGCLNRAFRFLLDPGCAFLALADNRYFRQNGELSLDVGAFVAALEYATGRHRELVGKPSQSFYQMAVESMRVPVSEVLMIGDDLESDVLGAKRAGLRGVLVRTGKYDKRRSQTKVGQPDALIDSIKHFPDLFKE